VYTHSACDGWAKSTVCVHTQEEEEVAYFPFIITIIAQINIIGSKCFNVSSGKTLPLI
jgi:hypothetical protein